MKDEKKNNEKEIIITTLSVLILIVAVFGISYSIWSQTFYGTKENSINTGYVSFTYNESDTNVIDIKNAVPMTDANGKMLTGGSNTFDFTVSAKFAGVSSIGYEVYATPIEKTIDTKYVKVYLTDQNDNPISGFDTTVPTYDNLTDSSETGSKTIYKSELTKSEEVKKYRLRVWISSDYDYPEESKKLSFKVNVKGMA